MNAQDTSAALPLLFAHEARVDAGGGVLLEGFSVEVTAERLALIGDFAALFKLCTGQAELTAGELRIAGSPARTAVVSGLLGVALQQVPLPERWTASEYLNYAARVGGHGRRDSEQRARGALDELGLNALAKRRLDELSEVDRRALGIAQAVLDKPAVLLLERPLQGLDLQLQRYLDAVIDRASAGRKLIVAIGNAHGHDMEQSLVMRSERALVLQAGLLVANGPPASLEQPTQRYVVTAARRGAELAAALTTRGARVWLRSEHGFLSPYEASSLLQPSTRLVIELPAGADAQMIIEQAAHDRVPIFELLPLAPSS